ncbi:MAG: TraR/DksA family transcriptional regulator [Chlamydiales bacterium]|nr:TraR/DksA family transcriptional regulator [Chlamydiales bacterium]
MATKKSLLSKQEMEGFKKVLEKLKRQLTKDLEGTSESVKENEGKGYSQHQADEGTDDFVRNISIEVSGKELAILRQIERCLEKMEEGTYGVCDVTGDPIPKKRLEAVPYATMTVSAQEQHEKGLI